MRTNWLEDLEDRMEEVRKDLAQRLHNAPILDAAGKRSAITDLHDEGHEYVASIELPGLRKEDVHLEVDERSLRVWGETVRESRKESKGAIRSERSSSSFQRYLSLPEEVNPDGARATFRNGVLEVVIPKASPEKRRGRQIEIG